MWTSYDASNPKSRWQRILSPHSCSRSKFKWLCVCNEKHPLYPCKMFKALTHDKRWWKLPRGIIFVSIVISLVTTLRNVPVLVCQRLHHTLLHIEPKPETQALFSTTNKVNQSLYLTHPTHSSHDMMVLLWRPVPSSTLVHQPHFVSDSLAQNLQLPKTSQVMKISGIQEFLITHLCTLLSTLTYLLYTARW